MKRVIKITDPVVIMDHLYAKLAEDDNERVFLKGQDIRTSRVINISDDGQEYETHNTIYRVVIVEQRSES